MAKLRTQKDVEALFQRNKLLNSNMVNYATQAALRSGSRSMGVTARLNRLQRKTKGQLKGLPGCGPSIKDWLQDY